YLQLLGMFDDEDVVWIGRDVFDTGSRKHASRFRYVREWLAESECPGSYTCPSTFHPGSYSRSEVNVCEAKFLVIESDVLSQADLAAIFHWLNIAVGLRL